MYLLNDYTSYTICFSPLDYVAATVSFQQSSYSLTEAGARFGISLDLSEPLSTELTVTVISSDITATANGT